ncbi:putative methyltransferase-like C25B8.10 [Holothuria leucospilota]|uniref:Methyltransferase-like C25B8.10 n=1 Tax=Holothuria leucospilota TaxID=206669 RepID=A0A9Q0YEK7_HOLLE|nr:putative methyltransferase-like C25B8.10 [Holothuria leucospilota]
MQKSLFRTKLSKDLIRQAVLHCDIQPDDSVLELGFGPGFGLKFAAECVKSGTGKVYGTDHSPDMVEEATKLIQKENLLENVELRLGDVHELFYKDESMDIVFHVNCYYFWDDRQKAITGIHRVLKYGGKMVTVFYKNDLVKAVEAGVLTKEEVDFERYMDELKLYNLCDVRMEEFNHTDSDATYVVIFAHKR